MQQRALPCSRRADDRDELATPHLDIDAAQDLEQLPVAAANTRRIAFAGEERVHSYRMAFTGSSRAACVLGYRGASVAITRLAPMTASASSGLFSPADGR